MSDETDEDDSNPAEAMEDFFTELQHVMSQFNVDAETRECRLAIKLTKSSNAINQLVDWLDYLDTEFETYVEENKHEFSQEEHHLMAAISEFASRLEDLGDEFSDDESDTNPFRVDDDTEFK